MKTNFWKNAVLIALAIFALTLPVWAFETPAENDLRVKAFQDENFDIPLGFISSAKLAAGGQDALLAPLAQLGVQGDGAFIDPRSGRWATLITATPMLPGAGNQLQWSNFNISAERTTAELETLATDAFSSWLRTHQVALGINMAELAPINATAYPGGRVIQLNALRVVHNVPVRDAMIQGVINNGNLVLFGATKWGDINVSSTPTLSSAQALDAVTAYLGTTRAPEWRQPALVYVPLAAGKDPFQVSIGSGYTHRLAWEISSATFDRGEWQALVDAQTGALITLEDQAKYLEETEDRLGAASPRSIVGGVYPVSNDGVAPDGVEVTLPMAFCAADFSGDTFTTNSAGEILSCLDGSISTALTGPYVAINDNCGAVAEASTDVVLDLGSGPGTDCAVPTGASAGNTHSSRSGFYEINRMMEIGRSYLPDNVFLQTQLGVEMNINDNCNATSGATLRFYRAGGGCANTGEIAGVFDHEWGHSMDRGDATPGVAGPSGEGIADLFAALRLNTSCIGRNFTNNNCGGFGDACLDCTGVRDIDWAKHANNTPHDVVWSNANCGGSVHCVGHVYSESIYDLWKREFTSSGMDDKTAQILTTQLTFTGSGGVSNWFTSTVAPEGDGCGAGGGYLNFLAADDDDGNLANGTPHMQDIFDAFSAHGIACTTPAVAVSGCAGAPTTAPVVTTQAVDRGVILSWGAVTGATEYQVFRSEGVLSCSMGSKLVATTSDLSYTDLELNNTLEYYYTVVPKIAGDSCTGPASACATATPSAGGNVAIDSSTADLTINTGDGDDFLDSCETATFCVDLNNVGGGSLTNVSIAGVSSPSHPLIDSTISFTGLVSASLATCNTATACFDFQAVSIEEGDVVELKLEVTADELNGINKMTTFEINNVEIDFAPAADASYTYESDLNGWTVEEGTFNRGSTVGGADGSSFAAESSASLDNQCDRIVSPLFMMEANTTLEAWTNFAIEGGNWDRANFALVAGNGTRMVIEPDTGRLYNATGNPQFAACTAGENGYGASMPTWASSGWSAGALDTAGLAGQAVRLEARYGTDVSVNDRGFAFDQINLTNISLQVTDAQANCADAGPGIFDDGFESGDTSAWSATNNP